MNHIYKVIFCKATGVFVAVAEFARAHGKKGSGAVGQAGEVKASATSVKYFALTALSGAMMVVSGQAMAAIVSSTGTGGGNPTSSNANSLAVGSGSTTTGAGTNSTAVGINASTLRQDGGSTAGSTAVGTNARVQGAEGLAIGYNAIAKKDTKGDGAQSVAVGALSEAAFGGVAVGHTAKANGGQSVAIGQLTRAVGAQSIAIGGDSVSQGASSIAIGGDDLDDASTMNADGTVAGTQLNSGNIATTYKSYTGKQMVDASSTAARYPTTTSGVAAVAIGVQSRASGGLSAAVGTSSIASGIAATAFGVGAEAARDNSVALGAGSTTANAAQSVKSAEVNGITYGGITVGNVTYGNFAGSASVDPGDQVSVGSTGYERQIKNVAPGAITASSTDAINGSQLYLTQQALGNVAKSTATNLGGGSKVGADGNLTAPTYNVVTPTGSNYKTANNVGDGLSNLNAYVNEGFKVQGNGTAQGTVTPTEAINFVNGTNTTATVSPEANGVTNVAFNVNTTTLTPNASTGTVAAGNTTGLANANDIANAINNAGFTLQAQGSNGSLVKPGATVNLNSSSPSLLTVSKNAADNTVNFDLSQTAKDGIAKGNTSVQAITTRISNDNGTSKTEAQTINQDQQYADFVAGDNITLSKADGGGIKISSTASATNNAGFNLQTNGDTASLVKNGDTVQLLNGQNIAITRDGNNITVATTKDLVADSLTTGNTVVNNDGITLTGGNNQPVTLTKDGLNNGGNKITNVAPGDISTDSTDAVNGSQLYTTNQNVANNADTIAKGFNISADNGNTDNVQLGETINYTSTDGNIVTTANNNQIDLGLAPVVTVGSTSPITIDGDNGTIGGLTNTDFDPNNIVSGQAATEDQLQQAAAAATTKLEDGTATTVGTNTNPDGSTTYNVNVQTDGTTLTVNGDNQLTAKTSGISAGNDGRVTTNEGDDPNSLVTAGNVTNAINNAGFNLQTNGDEASLIKNGDTVQLLDGQNIAITREGNNITVATTKDLVADSLTTGDQNGGAYIDRNIIGVGDNSTGQATVLQPGAITVGGPNNGIRIEGDAGKINGLTNKTFDPNNIVSGQAATEDQLQQAAAAATTKLEDGTATTVGTRTNTDGSTTYNVNVQTDGTTLTVNGDNQLTAVTTALNSDGKGNTNATNPDNLVKAGDIANAINNAGFNLQTNGDEASLIKNGDTVQLLDGQNIAITREGNNITVATTKDLVADSLTTGDQNGGAYIDRNIIGVGDNSTGQATVLQPGAITVGGPNNGIRIEGDAGKINGLTNKTFDPNNIVSGQAATEDQLQQAAAAATTKLEDGTATTVGTRTNTDGSTTYNVNVQTDGTTLTVNGDNQLTAVTTALNSDGKGNTNATNPDNLVKAGDIANAINNAGFNLQTNGDEASLVKNGDTVQLLDGQNIAITREGNNITVATTKDLVADSLTTGDQNSGAYIDRNIIGVGDNSTGQATVLQPGAITVGGPNNGIRIEGDAGKINGLTNKTFDPNNIVSGQAATEDQLQQAAAAATTKLEDGTATTVGTRTNTDGSTTYNVNVQTDGTTLIVNDNNQLTAQTSGIRAGNDGRVNINEGDNPDSLVTAGNVTNAINNAGFNLQTNGDTASLVKNGDTVQLLNGQNIAITRDGNNITVATTKDLVADSLTTGNTVVNNDGITLTGANNQPVTLTNNGLNNGGNKITNVAAGTADTDAVNVSQLQTAQAKATTKLEDGTATTVSSTPNADGSTTYKVNAQTDGTTLIVNDNNQLTAQTSGIRAGDNGRVNINEGDNPDSLVTAGNVTNAINNAGFNLQTNGDTASLVKNGDTVQLLNGQNIAITRDGNNITVATTKDLVADSLTTGDTVINNSGVTINNGNNAQPVTLTKDGLNNGGNKITNVAAGTADTDAVNVSQLQTAQAKATTKLEDGTATTVSSTPNADGSTTYKVNAQTDGTTLTVNGDNQLTAKTSGISAGNDGRVNINEGDNPDSLVTAGNVTNAINNAGFNLQTNGDEASLIKNGDTVQLLDGQNIAITRDGNNITVATTKDLVADSLTTGDTVINNSGVAINNGNNAQPVTLTKDGLNNGGNKITNVAAGTADTDAVNVSQLQTAQAKATTKLKDGTATTVETTTNEDGSTTYNVNVQTDGTTLTVNGDNQLTAKTSGISAGNDGRVNINEGDNPDSLVTAGNVTNAINNAGFNLQTNGDTASLVKNGDTVQLLDGQNIAITRDGNNITVATTKDLVADSLTTGDQNGGAYIDRNIIGVGDNSTGQATVLQPGAITVGGPNNGIRIEGDAGKINGLTNKTFDPNNIVSGQAATEDQLQQAAAAATTKLEDGTATTVGTRTNTDGSTTYNVNVQTDGTTLTVNGDNQLTAQTSGISAGNDGRVTTNEGDDPNSLVTAGNVTNAINNAGFNLQTNGDEASLVKNGDTVQLLDGQNIAITREGNNITVATTKDLVADSLTTGDTVINNSGVAINNGNNAQPVTLTNNGLNNGGNKITNVAAGTADTDAVNVSQLQTAQAKATTKLEDGTATTVETTTNEDGSTTYKVNAQTDGTTLTVNGDNQLTAKTSGISAGNDGRVTTNEGDNPDSLVTAGNITNAINNAGFNLQTNGDTASLVKNGDTVQLLDGQNIAITRDGNNITVATTKDLVADSLTTGNTVVNNDGVTLTGGNNQPVTLTKDGLNNGGNKITNVAAGTADTDAVNVSQLQTAQAKATTKLEDGTATTVSSTPNADGSTTYKVNAQTDGTTLTVNDNNQLTAQTSGIRAGNDGRVNINEGDNPDSLVTAGNVTNAINNAGFNLQTNGDTASLVKNGDTVQLLDGQNIAITREGNNITVATTKDLVADSLTTGNTVVNNDGVTLTGGNNQPVTLTKDGLNNGGNKITNVAAGTADTDAVNVSQLQTAQAKATTKLANGTATTVETTTNEDGSTTYKVNAQTDGTTLTVNGDNQLTAQTSGIRAGNDGRVNINEGDNPDSLVTAGNVTNAINNAGFNLQTNGDTASLVKNGDTVQLLDGQNIAITREGNNITVATTKDLVADSLTTGNTVVNNDGVTLTGGNNQPVTLTKDGLNNGGNKITNVAAGTADTDAVNVSQLQTAQAKATTKLANGTATTVETTTNEDGSTTYKVNAQTDGTTLTVNGDNQLTAQTSGIRAGNDGRVNINEGDNPDSLVTAGNVTNAINNAGFNLQTNGDTASLVKNGDTVQLLDGQNIAITREGNNITVATTKDLVADSLTTGDTVINNSGVAINNGNNAQPVTLTKDGLNNGGNKITNVAAGTADTDAVNVSQLQTAQAKATTKLKDGTATTVETTTNEDGSTTYNVNVQTDGTTLTVNGDNQLTAKTSGISAGNDGRVTTNEGDDPNSLVTAGNVTNAINNAGFNLQTNGDEASLVKNGDTVQLLDGQNIAITREGNNITVATTKDLVADSLTTGDQNGGAYIDRNIIGVGDNSTGQATVLQPGAITVGGPNNGIRIEGDAGKINGLTNKTFDPNNIVSGQAATEDQLQQAAAAATTKLEDGTATTVSSTPNADGSTTYNVNVQTDGTTLTVNGDNQLTAVTTALNSDGKGNTNATNPDNLVKAGDIANAINNAGFNLQTNGDEASLIKNGDTVQLLDGQNIAITRDGNNITVATTKDLVADSLTTGDTVINNSGVAINNGNNAQPVTLTKDGLNNGGNKITNVAAGTADTDAVNVSQLQTAQAKATTKLKDGTATTVETTTNEDGSTTYNVNVQTDGTTLTVNGDNQLTAQTSGISAGDNGRVNINEGDNPDSLVTAGNVTNAINNAGFNLQTNGDTASLVKNGDTVQLLDGQNIAITRDGNNITVATKPDVTFNSITAGDQNGGAYIDRNIIGVGDNSTGQATVLQPGAITVGGPNNGIRIEGDAGKINGLTNKTFDPNNIVSGQAATEDQLQQAAAASRTEVKKGTNVASVEQTTGNNGQNVYTINADGAKVTAGKGVNVEAGEKDSNNITNYTVSLNQATQDSLAKADSATQDVIAGDNITITRDGNNITVATKPDVTFNSITTGDQNGGAYIDRNIIGVGDNSTGQATVLQPGAITVGGPNNGIRIEGDAGKINGLTNKTFDPNNIVSGQAATEDQLQQAAAAATTKLEDGTATTVSSTPNADGSTTYKVNAQTDGTTLTVNGDNQLTAVTTALNSDGKGNTNATNPDNLVKAGDIANAINNAGFNLQTNGDEASLVKNGDTVQLLDGQNIAITRDGNNITVATTKDLVADSLTTGDTVINNSGVAINNGNNAQPVTLTKDGLNNGGNKITNVAAGTADTDAVNVSQLQTAQAKATTKLKDGTATTVETTTNEDGSTTYKVNAQTDGTTLTVNGDNQLTAQTSGIRAGNDGRVNINEGDNPDSLVTAGNVTNAINNAGFNLQTNGDTASLVKNGDTVQLLDGQNIAITREGNNITVATTKDLVADSLTTGNTVVNNDGVTLTGGNNQPVTLTNNGLNNGGNKITNVAAGTADTDAVNVSQLQTAQAKATTKLEDGTATTVSSTPNADGSTTYKVNAQTDGTTLTVNGDNQLTAQTSGIRAGNDGRVNINEGDNPDSLVTAGNVTNAINNAGFNLQTNGDTASLVKNGDTVQLLNGQNIAITRDGNNNITVATKPDVTFNSITAGDENGGAYIDRNIIGVGDNSTGQATVLQPGAITVGGPNNGIRIEGDAGKINGLTNKTFDPNNIVSGQAATEDQLQQAAAAATTKLEDGTATTVGTRTNTDGSTTYNVNVQTDGTTLTVNGDNQLTAVTTALNSDGKGNTNATNPDNLVKAGDIANAINNAGFNLQTNGDTASLVKNGDTVQLLDGQNIAITRDGNNITVATTKDLVADSLTTGNTVVNNDGVTLTGGNNQPVTLTKDGLNNGGNKITNVAAGTADTDAVNVSQLQTAQAKATTKLKDGTATTVETTTNEDGSTTYNVNVQTDGTTLTVNDNNQLTAQTSGIRAGNDGRVTTNEGDDPNSLVTAGNVTNAINNAGFNLQTNGDEASLIKNGDTVQLLDGQNIAITRDGNNNITVATKPNVVFDSVKAGNTTINQDGIDNGGKLITNVASGLQGKTLNQIKDEGSSSSQWSNAATIGDLTQVQTNISNTQQIVGGVDIDGNVVDGDGSMLTVVNADNSTTPITLTAAEALRTYDAVGTGTVETNSVLTAVKNINEQGTKYIHFNGGERSVGGQRGTNDEQSQANGSKSTAIGYKTDANGDAAVAIGNQVLANGQQAIAIGDRAQAVGSQSISIGTENIVTGKNSGAIGDPSIIDGDNSYSIGNNNRIGGTTQNAFILGNNVQLGADNDGNVTNNVSGAVALGNNTAVNVAGGVALGENSVASRAGLGNNVTINSGTITQATSDTTSQVFALQQSSQADKNAIIATATNSAGAVSVGRDGANRQITNVAAGSLDSDAVNVAQLRATAQAASQAATAANSKVAAGQNITVAPTQNSDGSTTYTIATTPNLVADSVTINNGNNPVVLNANGLNNGGNRITNVAAGVDGTDAVNVNQLNNAITGAAAGARTEIVAGTNIASVTKSTGENGQDIYTVNARGTNTSAGSNAVTVTRSDAGNNITNYAVDLSAASKASLAKADTAVQNVQAGQNITVSRDGNNVTVATTPDLVADSLTTGNTVVNHAGLTIKNGPSVTQRGINAGDQTITNVAAGVISADSKDAVNGSQLHATNQNVAQVQGDVAKLNNGAAGVVRYSNADTPTTPNGGVVSNDVTLVGKANEPVTIHNVASGRAVTDAVNVGQLSALEGKVNNAVNKLGYRIGDVHDQANAGISAAMATAALPQAFLPGKSMVSGGLASYNGEGAVAVGISTLSDNGRWVIKLSGTADTQGNAGGSVGAGFHW